MAKILPSIPLKVLHVLADSISTTGYQLQNTNNETKVHRGHIAKLSDYNRWIDNKSYWDSVSEDRDKWVDCIFDPI